MNASDGPNCLNFTLWTYVPDNSHEWGDLWYAPPELTAFMSDLSRNGEDLSIWSSDDMGKSDNYQDGDASPRDKLSVMGVSQDVASISTSTSASASSATLAPPTNTANSTYSLESIQSGEGVSASLILDGARAIAAVCRPFPIAIVGVPERIDFDIASTSFRLQVRVRADDLGKSSNGGTLVTEIYVPFVHYAASLAPYDTSTYPSDTSNNASKVSLLHESASPTPTEPLKLDIEVHVSGGTYTTSGQTLRWTYPIPIAGEAVHVIDIKRRGGALLRATGSVQHIGGWWEVCPRCVIA